MLHSMLWPGSSRDADDRGLGGEGRELLLSDAAARPATIPRQPDPKLSDEPARLAALRRYNLCDTNAEAPFEKIVTLVKSALGVSMVAVPFIDERRQWFKARRGLAVTETPRSVAFCNHTIRTRSPLIVPNAEADVRFADNPLVLGNPHIRSYIGVPLSTPDGYNVGALCAIDTAPRNFGSEEVALLTTFAQLTQDLLELRLVAATDHLTGALTRRAFLVEAGLAVDRFAADGQPAALVILDIDWFKTVNDTYGHPTGDEVLRAVGRCCMARLPAAGAFGRLGGEEFGMLLPGTDPGAAMAIAERVRQSIAALHLDRWLPFPITASFGVAPLKARISSIEGWNASADAALYAAKAAGRDCCRLADDR